MPIRRIRLQDAVAGGLALLFALGFAAVAWHLAERYGEIEERAADARQRFGELVDLAKDGIGPHTITLIESQIDGKQRERRAQEDKTASAAGAIASSEAEQQRLRREAADQGLDGLGPFDAGPAPRTWGPRIFFAKWWKWKAKKKIMDALNVQYRKHEQAIESIKAAVVQAKLVIKAIDHEVDRLRDLKNTTLQMLHDQGKRDAFAEEVRRSDTARTLLFLLHLPVALYFALLFTRSVFRLAILREWIGERRLCRAR